MSKQTEIGYEALEWKDDAAGGTPIEAAALNRMEGGTSDACEGVDELRTRRLPTYLVAQDGETATQDVYSDPILGPCLILDLAERATWYENGEDGEAHQRTLITSGSDVDEIRDSVSRVTLKPNVTDIMFLDMNNRNCPGFIMTTDEGLRVGIYAQEGLGFVFYDFTNQKRIGLCPFS